MTRSVRSFCLFLLLIALLPAAVTGQPKYRLMEYDGFNNAAGKVMRIVRDNQGMMWFGTSDGLYRYDGYEFRNFKSHAGDGIDMPSNRVGSLYNSSEGALWCLIDERAFLFDLRAYRYIDVMAQFEKQQGERYKIDRLRPLSCGMTWLFTDDGTMFVVDDHQPATSARLIARGENLEKVDAVCDTRGRSWILTASHTYTYLDGKLTKYDQTFSRAVSRGHSVWLVDAAGRLSCFDEATGQIKPWTARQLTSAVMGMTPVGDDKLALLTETGVLLISDDGRQLTATDVTWPVRKLVQDKYGRLWYLDYDSHLSTSDGKGRQVVKIPDVTLQDCNIHADKFGTQWFFDKNSDTYYASRQEPTRLYRYEKEGQKRGISNTINDGQGGCWFISNGRAYRLTFDAPDYWQLPLQAASQGRSAAYDAKGRLLVGTRYDKTITLFDKEGRLLGYLARDGHVSPVPTVFGASIYCIYRDSHGTLWMGSKADGLFRLRPQEDGTFVVGQYCKDEQQPYSITDNEIYDFTEDRQGRLWVATHRGGLVCVADIKADEPKFVHGGNDLKGWGKELPVGIGALLLTPKQQLLVGTSEGLLVADVAQKDVRRIAFKRHTREGARTESLSSNIVNDILQTSDGRIFVSTESGGINEITSADLLADQLCFRHFDSSTGFPSDMGGRLVEYNGSLWVTAPDRLIEMRLGSANAMDVNSFLIKDNPKFSNAAPICLKDGEWVFGTNDGAVVIDLLQLRNSTFVPPLVVTGVSIESRPIDYTAGGSDTIMLAPNERSLTLWFSALDYEDTEHVNYAYRIGDEGSSWTYIGQNHSIALPQLRPGTYRIAIRSTNSDGVWTDNQRMLTIIVKPTFWETPWAVLLILAIVGIVVGAVAYTLLYIRRIKRQQHDTMEKYLALLQITSGDPEPEPEGSDTEGLAEPEAAGADEPEAVDRPEEAAEGVDETDDQMMKRMMAFIESNLGNSDVTVDDIALACAVSRTGLHRKVKHLLGTSPMEFLREARLRKAMQLLSQTQKPVSEVAYQCGFSDPKYFSKCFKAATGQTPTEYKSDSAHTRRN